jgi:hypothetical protein
MALAKRDGVLPQADVSFCASSSRAQLAAAAPESVASGPNRDRVGAAGAGRAALRGVLRFAADTPSWRRTGLFGARMHVELVNDGPVTIILVT